MYPVYHNNPYRYGYWLPIQNFSTLGNALAYAQKEGACRVYDYNFKRWFTFI